MDLHIIQMFQTHIVFFCNIKSIPCKMRIVGGMRISSSDPAAGQDRILCINLYRDLSARLPISRILTGAPWFAATTKRSMSSTVSR